jgi:hypothetical protein
LKRIAIIQSNYIPWKGFFDLIAAVDEFVLYDNAQYTCGDWRNRNKIKTPQGALWLTVPVKSKGRFLQTIAETEIDGDAWATRHWQTLGQFYRRSPYFVRIAPLLAPIYLERRHTRLSALNRELIETVCRYLGISVELSDSSQFRLPPGKTERLLSICRQAGADEYLSGPAAKGYLDESLFRAAGVQVLWFDYDGYPEYPQPWGEFRHDVSILDLLFNCGPESPRYMKMASRCRALS